MSDAVAPDTDDSALPVVKDWDAWGRLFTDVATWMPALREIGRRAGLPVTTVEAGYPGTNAVFIVNAGTGTPYVVKIYCPFCHEDVTVERSLHPLLAQAPALPVPALLGQGVLRGEQVWPYLILSFLPGEAIRDVRPRIAPSNRVSISRDLGRRVRALHDLPRATLAPLVPVLGDWNVLAKEQATSTMQRLARSQILPPAVIEQLPGYVTAVLEDSGPSDLVLVNGDLTEDHILLEEHHGAWRISGLLDFADALIAPRDYEWVALWFGALDRDPACLRAFMEGYGAGIALDDAFRRRAMAFTCLHEFGGLMIEGMLSRLGHPPIKSLAHLENLCWPFSPTLGGLL